MNILLKNTAHIFTLLIVLLCNSCNEEDFLDGYNRNDLFSDPTPSEVDAVRSEWKSRDLSVNEYKVEQEIKIADVNAVLKVVSFIVNREKEYGAVLIPEVGSKLPVRVYVGGFGIDNKVNSENCLWITPASSLSFLHFRH